MWNNILYAMKNYVSYESDLENPVISLNISLPIINNIQILTIFYYCIAYHFPRSKLRGKA